MIGRIRHFLTFPALKSPKTAVSVIQKAGIGMLAEEKIHHGDSKTASSPAKAPDRPPFSQRLS
jgi:hypothetical protein